MSKHKLPPASHQASPLFGFRFDREETYFFVVLAWAFVATRLVHAGVFVTSNHVPTRFRAYMAGVLVLFVLWAVFAVRILLAPALP